jgi:ribosome-binding protein aMBF1 (putative translation factor)
VSSIQKVRNRRSSISQRPSARSDARANANQAAQVEATLRLERRTFAAKVRVARAILGWSQRELAARISMTQKSVYMIELGTNDLRRSTVVAIEQVLKAQGIEFEMLADGGFKVVVPETALPDL